MNEACLHLTWSCFWRCLATASGISSGESSFASAPLLLSRFLGDITSPSAAENVLLSVVVAVVSVAGRLAELLIGCKVKGETRVFRARSFVLLPRIDTHLSHLRL